MPLLCMKCSKIELKEMANRGILLLAPFHERTEPCELQAITSKPKIKRLYTDFASLYFIIHTVRQTPPYSLASNPGQWVWPGYEANYSHVMLCSATVILTVGWWGTTHYETSTTLQPCHALLCTQRSLQWVGGVLHTMRQTPHYSHVMLCSAHIDLYSGLVGYYTLYL